MIKKVKIFLKNLLYSHEFIDNQFLSFIQLKILSKVHQRKYYRIKIKSLEKTKILEKIIDGYFYESRTQNNQMIKVPDLNLYFFENALVNSYSSAVISKNILHYEVFNDKERYNEGFILYHSKKTAVYFLNEVETIEEGFFLAGNGSYNWYHWMIEILPKIIYFDTSHTKVILVNQSCQTIKSMADSLNLITENLNIKIVYLHPRKVYNVKKLFFINEVNKLMFNSENITFSDSYKYYFRKESLNNISNIFKSKITGTETCCKKLFLERKNTHRIAKNDKEIFTFLQQKGFVSADLRSLSFTEQINCLKNAKIIVGTTGASWTNLLFCEPSSYSIIFIPENFKNYRFFEEIGQMLNVKVDYLYYENGENDHDKSEFIIDIKNLENLLHEFEK
ncbi:glycosyltransferase family 61 protein [Halpernia frigidisoli]|uniref:Glycosyltransferase 61 catalytic domain-containing protein n=1 Tax=Halpernia frigidisoli TaxID=1125876 RepID=A0A1I3GLR9_9FLAO|nr:glycosyltransferase family 61 protein [Halpernia frigidisoli]SFI24182.1 Protein of unknown function [Halpernia frigidisoli]